MRKRQRELVVKLLAAGFIVLLLIRSNWLTSLLLANHHSHFHVNRGMAQSVGNEWTEDGEGQEQKSVIRQMMSENAKEPECDIPYLKTRTRPDMAREEADCHRLKPRRSSCKLAQQSFGDPMKLDIEGACKSPNIAEYCRIERQLDSLKVNCDSHSCDKTMFLGIEDVATGDRKWSSYKTLSGLKDAIKSLMKEPNAGYCLLHCGEGSDSDADLIPQILNLPPNVVKDSFNRKNEYMNFNFIFIDSVSRHHFYRSLPRSVNTLNEISGNKSNSVLLLDFELFQGVRSRTYETLQALFAGTINPYEIPFGTQEMPREKLKTDFLLKHLKEMQYSTLWIEDLCPYWEWGLSKDLLVYNRSLERKDLFSKFMEAVHNAGIDSVGNTFSSCDILHANEVPDPFHAPSKVCYNGRHQHEYILEYLQDYQRTMVKRSQPFFSFVETNVGHEGSGKRIQFFDPYLSEYLSIAGTLKDTLTVVFSDHGNAYGKFVERTPEARIEMYQPFLFMIIPESVQSFFTKDELQSLIVNQNRLISVLDLHCSISYIIEKLNHQVLVSESQSYVRFESKVSEFNKQFNITKYGLLGDISPHRTCSNLPRIMPNLCICEGYDAASDNLFYNSILALYVVGMINNQIQRQRHDYLSSMKDSNSPGGFGSCQKLKVNKIKNIHLSSEDPDNRLAKMDMYVGMPGQKFATEIFFISIRVDRRSTLSLGRFERITPYSRFSVCRDPGVDVELCICDTATNLSVSTEQSETSHAVTFQDPVHIEYYLQTMLHSEMKSNITVYNVNGIFCLYLVSQWNGAGIVFESYNNCNAALDVRFTIDTVNLLLSCPKTVQVRMVPGDFKFIAAGVGKSEDPWSSDIHLNVLF